jgi:hypothetical protein
MLQYSPYRMLFALPPDGVAISRQFHNHNRFGGLDQCSWDGLLGIFAPIVRIPPGREDSSPLSEYLFDNRRSPYAGK